MIGYEECYLYWLTNDLMQFVTRRTWDYIMHKICLHWTTSNYCVQEVAGIMYDPTPIFFQPPKSHENSCEYNANFTGFNDHKRWPQTTLIYQTIISHHPFSCAYTYSSFPRTVNRWNRLPGDVLTATSAGTFKGAVAAHIKTLPFLLTLFVHMHPTLAPHRSIQIFSLALHPTGGLCQVST